MSVDEKLGRVLALVEQIDTKVSNVESEQIEQGKQIVAIQVELKMNEKSKDKSATATWQYIFAISAIIIALGGIYEIIKSF